ncbi:MAG: hypothetical protein ACSHXA_07640 [Polaribacter sp.]|uniref:hypothetical protein n=1 Tax=Polaribacter sp. TaxID=1920175 RepID=UPI003EF0FE94
MVRLANITVFLLDGTTVAFKDVTLLEVAKKCLNHPLVNSNPLLLQIREDYKLYFNTDLFISWVKKDVELSELLDQVKVDNLVRNKEDIIEPNFSVEAGALWLQKDNLCYLEDIDSLVVTKNDDRFISITGII